MNDEKSTLSWIIRLCALPLFALTLLLALLPTVNADVPIPNLQSPVTDLTKTLTATESATLEQRLRAFEARKGSQVAVLMVPTTEPESIEQYAVRVEEAWKLGRKNIDDSVLLLIAKDDHKLHIEVGYGLEGALPDATADRIVREAITPQFKAGKFYAGISAGIDQIIRVIDGEPLPQPAHRPGNGDTLLGNPHFGSFFPFVLMMVLVGGRILRAVFGRFIGSGIAAGAAGFIVWLLMSVLSVSIVAAIIAFLFTIFSGGSGWSGGRRGGILGGGFGGGFGGMGGGSFGGGGFSGGGGGSGGGGASGSW